LKKIRGKIEMLITYNLLSRKFAVSVRKVQLFAPPTFLTHYHAADLCDRSIRCWKFRRSSRCSVAFTQAAASQSSLCMIVTCLIYDRSTTGLKRPAPHR